MFKNGIYLKKKGETIKETATLPSAPSTQRMFIENGVENRHNVSHKINKYKQKTLSASARDTRPTAPRRTWWPGRSELRPAPARTQKIKNNNIVFIYTSHRQQLLAGVEPIRRCGVSNTSGTFDRAAKQEDVERRRSEAYGGGHVVPEREMDRQIGASSSVMRTLLRSAAAARSTR